MDLSGFMHKYYDWDAFELFVKDLYEGDGDVIVERDVTEVDRYGARRQIDVKIVRRSRFHRYITLVECKRWKEPVSRDRIDVLASSIEALGAANGAIFTTTGFEEGAIAYAKGKGIELFVVRDLTAQEWGMPGRHVTLHLHVSAAEFRNIRSSAQAVLLIDDAQPSQVNLEFDLNREKALDPDYDLFSVKTGERGPNLMGLMGDAHSLILSAIGKSIPLLEEGKETILEISSRCELDLTRTKFRQLRLPAAAVRIERIGFDLITQISQTTINVDRGGSYDFAVMIESYVSDQRMVAHRIIGDANVTCRDAGLDGSDSPPTDEILENGSILKIYCSPWVGLGGAVGNKNGVTNAPIRVAVEAEGKKHQLSLVS